MSSNLDYRILLKTFLGYIASWSTLDSTYIKDIVEPGHSWAIRGATRQDLSHQTEQLVLWGQLYGQSMFIDGHAGLTEGHVFYHVYELWVNWSDMKDLSILTTKFLDCN